MKNPNRYGTCYRLKGTRRRPYIAKVFIGYNEETLRPNYKNLGYFETKEEGLMTLAEYHNNPEGTGDKTTLKELFNRWKETAYDDISKATQDNYNAAYKLMEELHEEPFRSIKKSDFTKVIRDTNKSRSTMAKMKTLIKQLSDYAQDERLIKPEENNAGNIKLPKEEKKKQEIFTENEIEMLIKNSSDYWVQSILILIYTGLRVSEYLEAETSRIDLEQRTMIAGKKTEAGYNRIIPLHEKIVPFIEARMDKETLEEVNADNYRKKYYYPTLEKLGLGKKVPHVCRHTCATRMAEAGLNPMTIKQILGHTDYAFTANKYTHIQLEAIANEMKKLN